MGVVVSVLAACGGSDGSGAAAAGGAAGNGGTNAAGASGAGGNAGTGNAGGSAGNAGAGGAGGASVAVETVVAYALGDQAEEPALALAPDGQPRIAFLRTLGTRSDVMYAERDAGGGWALSEIQSKVSDLQPDIIVDSAGEPSVLYRDAGLQYAYRTAGSWQKLTVSPVVTDFALTAGPADSVHVAFHAGADVMYGKWNGTGFDLDVVATADSSTPFRSDFIDLAVAADGTVHIAFEGRFAGAQEVRYAVGMPGAFAQSAIATDRGIVSLALGPSGSPHIAATTLAAFPGANLLWLRQIAGSWQETEVAQASEVWATSIGVDGTDQARFALVCSSCGNDWDFIHVRPSSGAFEAINLGAGDSGDMVVEPDGSAHLAFALRTASASELHYAELE